MTHLKESELVEILYGDFETGANPAQLSHLQDCPACQKRLAGLTGVTRLLDAWDVDESVAASGSDSGLPAGLQAMFDEADEGRVTAKRGASVARTRSRGFGWPGKVLAASLLFAIAAGGFWFGMQYQERLVADQIDRRLGQLELRLAENWQAAWETHQNGLAPDATAAPLPGRLETALARLSSEQRALRRDLQALAVNAESEIFFTNQELQSAIQALDRLQKMTGISF